MLPNGQYAVVELEKLTDYCLSLSHPRGRHKARVFLAALAVSSRHAGELRAELQRAAREREATTSFTDDFGTRYTIEFVWQREDRSALIHSAWIIRTAEFIPRFVTCYVV